MGDKPTEPWKLTLSELWSAITFGHKPLAVALALLVFVVPGAYGLGTFYWTAVSSAYERFFARTSVMSPEEENLRNEWVAVVSYWATEKEAREAASIFKNAYSNYETDLRSASGVQYPMWRDDIVVARDPERSGRWLIAIDMYYGPSTEPVVSAELARVARLGGVNPVAQNTYQKLFVGSRALCYSQRVFEQTYGKVDPAPKPKVDLEGRPYVPCGALEAS